MMRFWDLNSEFPFRFWGLLSPSLLFDIVCSFPFQVSLLLPPTSISVP